jgi:hypothetical protein
MLDVQLISGPAQALMQSISAGCTRSLDIPSPIMDMMEVKFVCHFSYFHSVGQILKKKIMYSQLDVYV